MGTTQVTNTPRFPDYRPPSSVSLGGVPSGCFASSGSCLRCPSLSSLGALVGISGTRVCIVATLVPAGSSSVSQSSLGSRWKSWPRMAAALPGLQGQRELTSARDKDHHPLLKVEGKEATHSHVWAHTQTRLGRGASPGCGQGTRSGIFGQEFCPIPVRAGPGGRETHSLFPCQERGLVPSHLPLSWLSPGPPLIFPSVSRHEKETCGDTQSCDRYWTDLHSASWKVSQMMSLPWSTLQGFSARS